MGYRLAADAVLLLHLGFIAFAVPNGTGVHRWAQRWALPHFGNGAFDMVECHSGGVGFL